MQIAEITRKFMQLEVNAVRRRLLRVTALGMKVYGEYGQCNDYSDPSFTPPSLRLAPFSRDWQKAHTSNTPVWAPKMQLR